MDFDCLGSLILVKKLFPDYRLVRSSRIHPAAQVICDFYEWHFDFLYPKDIISEKIDNIIIVDTCATSRVSEYFSNIQNSSPSIRIFDHHPAENCDIAGAQVEGGQFGATTSLLGKMAMQKGLVLSPEEATIALTAIYADTGKLIYESVTKDDYEVSAWLLGMGASLRLVRSFLQTIKESEQIALLNQIKPASHTIHGNMVLLSYTELVENVPGLSAVVEKVMENQSPDAYFAIFYVINEDLVLIIARSQRENINLNALLSNYGGGGHMFAASARVSGSGGLKFVQEFLSHLEQYIKPAARADEIMTKNVFTIHETTSLKDASMFLERVELTAVPVVGEQGGVTGLISLRDIMKGRKHGKMHAPVTAYMSTPVISVESNASMREIEHIFYRNKISHLPVLDEGKLMGIVSRWDYLQFTSRAYTL